MTGTPNTSNNASPTAQIPLGQDIPCARCGYNLRTQIPDGRCPECGAAVEEALRRYVSADAHWLRGLVWGIGLILVGAIGTLIELAPMVFDSGIRHGPPPALSVLPSLGIQLVLPVGLWLFTKPDPSGGVVRPSNIVGWVARGAAIAYVLGWAAVDLGELRLLTRFWNYDALILIWLTGTAGLVALAFAIRCRLICQWVSGKGSVWRVFVGLPSVLGLPITVVAIFGGLWLVWLYNTLQFGGGSDLAFLIVYLGAWWVIPVLILATLWTPFALLGFTDTLLQRAAQNRLQDGP